MSRELQSLCTSSISMLDDLPVSDRSPDQSKLQARAFVSSFNEKARAIGCSIPSDLQSILENLEKRVDESQVGIQYLINTIKIITLRCRDLEDIELDDLIDWGDDDNLLMSKDDVDSAQESEHMMQMRAVIDGGRRVNAKDMELLLHKEHASLLQQLIRNRKQTVFVRDVVFKQGQASVKRREVQDPKAAIKAIAASYLLDSDVKKTKADKVSAIQTLVTGQFPKKGGGFSKLFHDVDTLVAILAGLDEDLGADALGYVQVVAKGMKVSKRDPNDASKRLAQKGLLAMRLGDSAQEASKLLSGLKAGEVSVYVSDSDVMTQDDLDVFYQRVRDFTVSSNKDIAKTQEMARAYLLSKPLAMDKDTLQVAELFLQTGNPVYQAVLEKNLEYIKQYVAGLVVTGPFPPLAQSAKLYVAGLKSVSDKKGIAAAYQAITGPYYDYLSSDAPSQGTTFDAYHRQYRHLRGQFTQASASGNNWHALLAVMAQPKNREHLERIVDEYVEKHPVDFHENSLRFYAHRYLKAVLSGEQRARAKDIASALDVLRTGKYPKVGSGFDQYLTQPSIFAGLFYSKNMTITKWHRSKARAMAKKVHVGRSPDRRLMRSDLISCSDPELVRGAVNGLLCSAPEVYSGPLHTIEEWIQVLGKNSSINQGILDQIVVSVKKHTFQNSLSSKQAFVQDYLERAKSNCSPAALRTAMLILRDERYPEKQEAVTLRIALLKRDLKAVKNMLGKRKPSGLDQAHAQAFVLDAGRHVKWDAIIYASEVCQELDHASEPKAFKGYCELFSMLSGSFYGHEGMNDSRADRKAAAIKPGGGFSEAKWRQLLDPKHRAMSRWIVDNYRLDQHLPGYGIRMLAQQYLLESCYDKGSVKDLRSGLEALQTGLFPAKGSGFDRYLSTPMHLFDALRTRNDKLSEAEVAKVKAVMKAQRLSSAPKDAIKREQRQDLLKLQVAVSCKGVWRKLSSYVTGYAHAEDQGRNPIAIVSDLTKKDSINKADLETFYRALLVYPCVTTEQCNARLVLLDKSLVNKQELTIAITYLRTGNPMYAMLLNKDIKALHEAAGAIQESVDRFDFDQMSAKHYLQSISSTQDVASILEAIAVATHNVHVFDKSGQTAFHAYHATFLALEDDWGRVSSFDDPKVRRMLTDSKNRSHVLRLVRSAKLIESNKLSNLAKDYLLEQGTKASGRDLLVAIDALRAGAFPAKGSAFYRHLNTPQKLQFAFAGRYKDLSAAKVTKWHEVMTDAKHQGMITELLYEVDSESHEALGVLATRYLAQKGKRLSRKDRIAALETWRVGQLPAKGSGFYRYLSNPSNWVDDASNVASYFGDAEQDLILKRAQEYLTSDEAQANPAMSMAALAIVCKQDYDVLALDPDSSLFKALAFNDGANLLERLAEQYDQHKGSHHYDEQLAMIMQWGDFGENEDQFMQSLQSKYPVFGTYFVGQLNVHRKTRNAALGNPVRIALFNNIGRIIRVYDHAKTVKARQSALKKAVSLLGDARFGATDVPKQRLVPIQRAAWQYVEDCPKVAPHWNPAIDDRTERSAGAETKDAPTMRVALAILRDGRIPVGAFDAIDDTKLLAMMVEEGCADEVLQDYMRDSDVSILNAKDLKKIQVLISGYSDEADRGLKDKGRLSNRQIAKAYLQDAKAGVKGSDVHRALGILCKGQNPSKDQDYAMDRYHTMCHTLHHVINGHYGTSYFTTYLKDLVAPQNRAMLQLIVDKRLKPADDPKKGIKSLAAAYLQEAIEAGDTKGIESAVRAIITGDFPRKGTGFDHYINSMDRLAQALQGRGVELVPADVQKIQALVKAETISATDPKDASKRRARDLLLAAKSGNQAQDVFPHVMPFVEGLQGRFAFSSADYDAVPKGLNYLVEKLKFADEPVSKQDRERFYMLVQHYQGPHKEAQSFLLDHPMDLDRSAMIAALNYLITGDSAKGSHLVNPQSAYYKACVTQRKEIDGGYLRVEHGRMTKSGLLRIRADLAVDLVKTDKPEVDLLRSIATVYLSRISARSDASTVLEAQKWLSSETSFDQVNFYRINRKSRLYQYLKEVFPAEFGLEVVLDDRFMGEQSWLKNRLEDLANKSLNAQGINELKAVAKLMSVEDENDIAADMKSVARVYLAERLSGRSDPKMRAIAIQLLVTGELSEKDQQVLNAKKSSDLSLALNYVNPDSTDTQCPQWLDGVELYAAHDKARPVNSLSGNNVFSGSSSDDALSPDEHGRIQQGNSNVRGGGRRRSV